MQQKKEAFYSRLSYSIGNEDWKTEMKALKIQPQDRVLAVTASGDRPLNLLSSGCLQILAIDTNPAQNALCELKKIALAELEHEKYLAFLGVLPTTFRREIFQQLKSKLDYDTLSYWENNLRKILQGILYQGAVEKWLKRTATALQWVVGPKIDRLFNCATLEEQQNYVKEKWNPRALKRLLSVALHPQLTRFVLKDPGLYAYVDPELSISNYIHNKALHSLQHFPVKENIILSLICKGKVYEEAFSPYLTLEGTKEIQPHLAKLSCKTANLITYLDECEEESMDCFSFSDIASYMSQEDFRRLCFGLYKAARPGARFCIRQFLSPYQIPPELTPYLQRDLALEAELEREDRCFVYRFFAGRVIKS